MIWYYRVGHLDYTHMNRRLYPISGCHDDRRIRHISDFLNFPENWSVSSDTETVLYNDISIEIPVYKFGDLCIVEKQMADYLYREKLHDLKNHMVLPPIIDS